MLTRLRSSVYDIFCHKVALWALGEGLGGLIVQPCHISHWHRKMTCVKLAHHCRTRMQA